MKIGTVVTLECVKCRQNFTSVTGRGQRLKYCLSCTPSYQRLKATPKQSTISRQVAEESFTSALLPKLEASRIVTRDTSTNTESSHPTITLPTGAKDSKQKRFTLTAPKERAKIVSVCDHIFKYAEAVIELREYGEIIRTIIISVNAKSWTMKVLMDD